METCYAESTTPSRGGNRMRRVSCETMVADDQGRSPQADRGQRGQCVYRKWDLDHNCRIGYDFANRSIAQCANRRIQSNHQQSQYDPVRRVQDRQGNSFIEILLVLPLVLTVIFGTIGIFQWAQVSDIAGNAAQAAAQEWAATGNPTLAQEYVRLTLTNEGYNPSGATAEYVQQGSLDEVTVSLPVQATMWPYSAVSSTRSAVEQTGVNNNAPAPWW